MFRGSAIIFCALIAAVCGQDCAPRWIPYNGKCWYFSDQTDGHAVGMTWLEAESYCQTQNAHLASFETVEERDWVFNNYLVNWQQTHWWIGATDVKTEGTFYWTDGTPWDTNVEYWKQLEPSNSGKEDCVEVWVDRPLYTGQWNDNNCDQVDPFICKGETGSFQSFCPVGWTNIGEQCYKITNTESQWHYANAECEAQGAHLVSITSQEEQTAITELISPQNEDFWLGLSDESTPGDLQWSNPGAVGSSYDNYAPGQPPSPLNYQGSTCSYLSAGNNYQWITGKCSKEYKFVCQRGLNGRCPYGWSLLGSKCYEFIINQNRLLTWTSANEFCVAQGAKMLKIETEEEHTGVGNVLQQFQDLGFQEIWLGGSDVGHDEEFMWADKTFIDPNYAYWSDGQPRSTAGREDCMAIYTGNTEKNWEALSCFTERPFICELPVGATLPSFPVVSVDGKCETGWRHFRDYCYWFSEVDDTQAGANSKCSENSATLVSLLNEDELSFVVGHIQDSSWIGLQYSQGSYLWTDGSSFNFNNWGENRPSNQPCVFMQDTGEWNDAPCNEYHNYVCKKDEIPSPEVTYPPPTGNPADVAKCGTGGWISDPSSTQCYYINVFQIRSWDDARHTCQSIGGDLISINSPQEQEFIHLATVNLPTAGNFWIGAIDPNRFQVDVADGGWKWSDGTPFNYLNWNSGEPNDADQEDCTEMHAWDGKWNDVKCDRFFHFICEKTGNTDNSVNADVEDSNCRSNEACCFKHLGVEYGGRYDDSVLSASSIKNEYYVASRGRLNSPADVIVITDGVALGTGHGAWMPKRSDPDPWLQVDLTGHMEVKGIITQGRNGIVQYTERQWTTSFKISYSQDSMNTGSAVTGWEWLANQDGDPIIFGGNNDQNTQVTNLFPRPIIARHIRCHPVTWKDQDDDPAALRLEYIGCYASCLHKLGMSSGLISDMMITASSSGPGSSPIDARAPVDKDECLTSGADKGADYRGWISKTVSGRTCQAWSSQSPHRHDETSQQYPDADLRSNYCRNPNQEQSPWCYTTDPDVEWEYCNVPICPSNNPQGWSPSSSNTNQYVQAQFSDFYKVSGITIYGSTSMYVSKYVVMYSDDGMNFRTYQVLTGQDKVFQGLDGTVTEYTDILSEPISAKYVRIQPRQWVGNQIKLQFEIHGCYVDKRITCSDLASDFEEESLSLNCPSGCVEDINKGPVYGTKVYTENSAICPAAIHAGRATNQLGGSVELVKTPGLTQYLGTFANGIQSLDASSAHLSLEFDGSVFRCEEGWKPYQDHCYYLTTKDVSKNWQDARADCISMGADLVSIHSPAESHFVEYTIQGARIGKDVWIGLNDLRTLNYFQWADETPVVYTNWYLNEPNGGNERCVNVYRLTGAWNDRNCAFETGYMCKKEKEMLPPLEEELPVDEGCEAGWTAYGSSCYRASADRFIFLYAERICRENGGSLVSIQDDYENAFVHALVTNALPPGLGYTTWLGMAARTGETGELYYAWENGEPVTYTHWMQGEPDVVRDCYFPFEYEGQLYYECIDFDHPARQDHPWCSVDPVFSRRWINCDTGYEASCAYMDDNTGFWGIEFCLQDRYYVCEKDRVGYTQPGYTTPPTTGTCPTGWRGDTTTSHCYQINEFSASDINKRLNWNDALDYCRGQGADLVSLHSEEEAAAITRFVTQAGVYSYTYFWIGLNILNTDAGYTWSDGTPTDYTNWATSEPNDNQGLEKCVEGQFYDATTGWNDLSCNSLRNYICKIPKGKDPLPPPTLPPPDGNEGDPVCGSSSDGTWISYQPSYGTQKCYMFITEPAYGWQFAENDCATRGGNLVSVHSDDENDFLLGRIGLTSRGIYWLGLRDIGERAFFWSDESFVDYQKWASGEPNNYYDSEGCTTIHVDGGTWNDDNCGRTYGYVCQKIPGSIVNPPPPTQPATGNCPADFVPYGNNCYMTGGDTKDTWENARQWCADNNAELVSITNGYEQAFMNNYLFGTRQRFWIGLSDRNTNNGQFVWIDEVEVSYLNWAPGEPSGVSEGCAVLDTNNNGWWYDDDCYSTNSFICYIPKSDSIGAPAPTQSPLNCPSGFYSSTHEPACYQLVDEPKSWEDARQYCRDQGDGIELVSIHEIYDNDLIKSWFWHDVTSGESLWIGMTFTATVDGETVSKFVWSDGWPVLYTNWGPSEPNDNSVNTGDGCVMMNADGFWAAVPTSGSGNTCNTPMPFVCKKSLEDIPTTPPVPDGICDTGFVALGQYCYYFNFALVDDSRKNWFDASRACEQRHSTLASIHSAEENMMLEEIMAGSTTSALYIGLESDGFGGWHWADETGAEYFNWNDGEPNGEDSEECVEMYAIGGKWNDIRCEETKGYVCKKVRGSTRCAVGTGRRIDCGNDRDGISEDYCVTRRGCCWDETWKGGNNSGCFYDEDYTNIVDPTEEPVDNGKSGTSTGVIVAVVIVVILVLAIVGGVVYCKCFSSSKSLPSLSMPSMPASWTSSSSKSSPNPQDAAGFDNPMALGDDGNFHTVA